MFYLLVFESIDKSGIASATLEQVQRELYGALSSTKRFSEEHLLNTKDSVVDLDETVLVPLDEMLKSSLSSEQILSLEARYCFPVSVKAREAAYPSSPSLESEILRSIDPSLIVNSLEQEVLDDEVR